MEGNDITSSLDFSGWTITVGSLDVYLTDDGTDIENIYYDFHMKIPENWI